MKGTLGYFKALCPRRFLTFYLLLSEISSFFLVASIDYPVFNINQPDTLVSVSSLL